MEELFITNIHINEVRHLKDFDIPLSETERKHLILTGRNGSGKTSVLEALMSSLEMHTTNENRRKLDEKIAKDENIKKYWQEFFRDSTRVLALGVRISIPWHTFWNYDHKKNFNEVLFFPARRRPEFETPKVIEKITDFKGTQFLKYLLNITADKAFALEEKDSEAAKKTDEWLSNFKLSLRDLFGDPELEFDFNRKDYHYYIKQKGKKAVHFNQLPDGFASIIEIITEILMGIEEIGQSPHKIQGIVLIDEIETHLHIDLQKKVLPFLTSFFPKIQFIVTTHSPFVLTSISNAVIFDLEKQEPIEDLSSYSYKAIVENYFGNDLYSETLKSQVARYEELLDKANQTDKEFDELALLELRLNAVPKFNSEELAGKLQQLRLKHLKKAH